MPEPNIHAHLEVAHLSSILLFTDGACFPDLPGRPGGWAAVTGEGILWSGAVPLTTSVNMEIRAIAEGLARTPPGAAVQVYTDSTSAIYHIKRLRKVRDSSRRDPVDQQLAALLSERSITLIHHPDADRHPSHRAAHVAARRAALAEGGIPTQALFNRAQSAGQRLLLTGGTTADRFTYQDLVRAAPALYVELRRSSHPRVLALFASNWEEIVACLQAIGGIPYCLSAAFQAASGAATVPPPGVPVALAPDFLPGAGLDLESALAIMARHGLCLEAIQQQVRLRDQLSRLTGLPGWSRTGELTYACDFGRHGYGGHATIRLDLASRAVIPGPLYVEVNGTHQAVHAWSLSLRRRVATALRQIGAQAVLQFEGSAVTIVPANQFAAALRAAVDAYWNEQAAQALHMVDGQEQLRPDIHLWPGPGGAWRWQLPGTGASPLVPSPIRRRVLAGYRARLLHLASHPDLVAAAGARPTRRPRPGLQLAQ